MTAVYRLIFNYRIIKFPNYKILSRFHKILRSFA